MEEIVFARQLVSTVKRGLGLIMKISLIIEIEEIAAMKSTSSIKKTMMSLDLRVIQTMKTYWAGRLSPWLIGTTLKSETSKINLAVIFNIVNSIILGFMKLQSDSMMQNFPKK